MLCIHFLLYDEQVWYSNVSHKLSVSSLRQEMRSLLLLHTILTLKSNQNSLNTYLLRVVYFVQINNPSGTSHHLAMDLAIMSMVPHWALPAPNNGNKDSRVSWESRLLSSLKSHSHMTIWHKMKSSHWYHSPAQGETSATPLMPFPFPFWRKVVAIVPNCSRSYYKYFSFLFDYF